MHRFKYTIIDFDIKQAKSQKLVSLYSLPYSDYTVILQTDPL